jgi:hypothetical protein
MAPAIFAVDSDPTLAGFRREVIEHRDVGRVRVELRRIEGAGSASASSLATAFVETLGLSPPRAWTELRNEEALEAVTRVLQMDLAYKAPVMAVDVANGLARRFLAYFGEAAVFLTNGSLALTSTGAWSALTDATFDAGVIGVSSSRVGMLWVEDED